MINICIIGAGQLGSRHLQALANVQQQLNIYVVDSKQDALDMAKERYNEVDIRCIHKVKYYRDMSNLPQQMTIAIIASTSRLRRKIIEELVRGKTVKFLILEKWICNSIEDLDAIEKMLSDKNIKTWVNCPMRMMPFYENVKEKMGGFPITYNVTGTMFGLMTNLIHYIDFIVFMTGCNSFIVDTTQINRNLIESKREGYSELIGTVAVFFEDGSIGVISCNQYGDIPSLSQIKSGERRIIVDEANGKAICQEGNEWSFVDFYIPYQSELTTILVNELLETGECRLPTYNNSAQTHRNLIEPFLKFLKEETNNKRDEFPFT